MAEADAPILHLIDSVAMAADQGARRASVEGAAILAMRAARPILDRMDRAARARIGAAVVSHPDADARKVRDVTDCVCSGLPITVDLQLPIYGLGDAGLFAALHMARAAMLSGVQEVLVLSFSGAAVGASLLGAQGAIACRPLPPARATAEGMEDGVARDRPAAGLVRMVERGGLRRREIRSAASPGLPRLEAARLLREAGMSHAIPPGRPGGLVAATAEETLAAAVLGTPPSRTLIWSRDGDGGVAGCVLERG